MPRDATWPRFPRIGVFYIKGQWARQGGEMIKLSNYQISKLTKSGLLGPGKKTPGAAFIGDVHAVSPGSPHGGAIHGDGIFETKGKT